MKSEYKSMSEETARKHAGIELNKGELEKIALEIKSNLATNEIIQAGIEIGKMNDSLEKVYDTINASISSLEKINNCEETNGGVAPQYIREFKEQMTCYLNNIKKNITDLDRHYMEGLGLIKSELNPEIKK